MIPGEVTSALQNVTRAFTESLPQSAATREASSDDPAVQAAKDAAKAAEAAAEALADAAEADSGAATQPRIAGRGSGATPASGSPN